MSIRIKCDRCTKKTVFYGSEAEAIEAGWEVQDFGHTCWNCSKELAEIEGLDDSSTASTRQIAEALTEGLKK